MNEETNKNEEIHTNEEVSTDEMLPTGGEGSINRENPAEGKGPVDKGNDIASDGAKGKKKASRKSKKKAKKKAKKKGRVSVSTIILVAIMLAGAGIFLYPAISDWWNSMHATQAIAGYVSAVEDMSEEEKEEAFEKARIYNESLPNGVNFNLSDEEYAEYESILDITGTGIMGYVQIKSIGVNLPIYHGVDEGLLQIAVGHIPGSSFPVGGERTHSVMSGHRGLPSAKLFSDLDKLSEGDTFTITVLDQTVTYMVDQIRIVLPEETDELGIIEGEDYCTLTTCTPYGINSHRILMRGHRIDNLDGIALPAEAVQIPTYVVIPAVGIPILFMVLLVMLIYYRRRGPRKSTQEMLDELRKQR